MLILILLFFIGEADRLELSAPAQHKSDAFSSILFAMFSETESKGQDFH